MWLAEEIFDGLLSHIKAKYPSYYFCIFFIFYQIDFSDVLIKINNNNRAEMSA